MKKIALAVAASLSFAAFAGAPPATEAKDTKKPVEATTKKVAVAEEKKEETVVTKKEDGTATTTTLKTEKKAETKPAAAVPVTK